MVNAGTAAFLQQVRRVWNCGLRETWNGHIVFVRNVWGLIRDHRSFLFGDGVQQ
jgi:hypothetical protein